MSIKKPRQNCYFQDFLKYKTRIVIMWQWKHIVTPKPHNLLGKIILHILQNIENQLEVMAESLSIG